MKKAVVILFMAIYALGMLLHPLGDMTYNGSMKLIYDHCKAEDPDMDVADFVLEHLLNLDDVFDCFEHGSEEKNEKPHQPFQQIHTSAQVTIVVSKPIHFDTHQIGLCYAPKTIHTIYKSPYIPSGYLTEVFRPPSSC